jgi:hypothetical protein
MAWVVKINRDEVHARRVRDHARSEHWPLPMARRTIEVL